MLVSSQPISDMTREELEVLIEEVIDRRLQNLLKPKDTRSMAEINESIRKNRWTPPSGAKSSLEMLREDRDR
jgi:hypothetical protein